MLTGLGRVIVQKSDTGKISKVLIYVPTDVAKDSQFPYEESAEAKVTVGKNGVISVTPS